MKTGKFVVQHHVAKVAGPHDDLRLELHSGTLTSWAVPKGVPRESGKKVLAVETKPHSMYWFNFSGTIKEGYGAGKVTIVDNGTMNIVKDSPHSIIVELKGRRGKIKGRYVLVQPPSLQKQNKKLNQKKWILWKSK